MTLVREPTLRAATGATRETLRSLVSKKWIVREDLSSARDATRKVKVAVLKPAPAETAPAKLNENQRKILAHLECAGGRIALDELRQLTVPKTTLATLVRRGLVEIVEEAAQREQPAMKPRTPWNFSLPPRNSRRSMPFIRAWRRAASRRCSFTASPDRAKRRCIWQP